MALPAAARLPGAAFARPGEGALRLGPGEKAGAPLAELELRAAPVVSAGQGVYPVPMPVRTRAHPPRRTERIAPRSAQGSRHWVWTRLRRP